MVLTSFAPVSDNRSQRAKFGGDMTVRDCCTVMSINRQRDIYLVNDRIESLEHLSQSLGQIVDSRLMGSLDVVVNQYIHGTLLL